MNPEILVAGLGIPLARAQHWAPILDETTERFGINSPARLAAFLAQIATESGDFRYVKEIWGPTKWQLKYEGHTGLGNTQPGDEIRFLGRGLIQVTGRSNYRKCGQALGIDLEAHPEALEQHRNAALSAGWYWDCAHLNALADAGDFNGITRRINGPGMLGADIRLAKFRKLSLVLKNK